MDHGAPPRVACALFLNKTWRAGEREANRGAANGRQALVIPDLEREGREIQHLNHQATTPPPCPKSYSSRGPPPARRKAGEERKRT